MSNKTLLVEIKTDLRQKPCHLRFLGLEQNELHNHTEKNESVSKLMT